MSRQELPAHSSSSWPERADHASRLAVPEWCKVRVGRGAVLLVAPHGGRRPTAGTAAAGVKVNDLHSAELATELADALDASLIANSGLDRNQLDLNRISQVASRAAWFPVLIEDLIAAILTRHERAEVLFLHGWNNHQAKCDIGVGHPLAGEAAAAAHAERLTASPAYVASRLAALRTACAARGILAPFGERYPGRHANNVLQLFRRDRDGTPCAPRLAAWSAAGLIEAVQLELALPLRWPGPPRRAFSDALCATFRGNPSPSAAASTAQPTSPRRRSAPAEPMALQTYDGGSGIGIMARLDPTADGRRVGSRLLLFHGGQRVALFTGDDAQPQPSGGGPHVHAERDGLRLAFDGWLLCTDDGRRYLDLEGALAHSRLLSLRVELRFTRRRDEYGAVSGRVAIDGHAQPFAAPGFCPPAGLPPAPTPWLGGLTLRAGLGDDAAVFVRHGVPGGTRLREIDGRGEREQPCAAVSLRCDDDAHSPRAIAVDDAGGGLVAEPIARLAVVRPLGAGRRARVTFGVARVARRGASGFGFFEYARLLL